MDARTVMARDWKIKCKRGYFNLAGRVKRGYFRGVMKTTITENKVTIPDSESLPCVIRHQIGGHYASQSSSFVTGSGRRFRPVFVAIEKFKRDSSGFGRSVYSCTANGETFYFWKPKGNGLCKPFMNADVNPECDLVES